MHEPLPPFIEDWSSTTLVLRCEYANDSSPLFVTLAFAWHFGIAIDVIKITDVDGNDLEIGLPTVLYRTLLRHLHTDFHLVAKTLSWLHEHPNHMPKPPSRDGDDAVKNWKMDRAESEEP